MKYKIDAADSDVTEALGESIGKQMRGGEVIELAGDVGSGKTTFVRGLARGLGSPDHVASPTYVLTKTYRGRLTLHHLDLYRLDEPGLALLQLSETLQEDSLAVTAIEWADSVAGILPEERITIRFKIAANEHRVLQVTIPKKLEYIKC